MGDIKSNTLKKLNEAVSQGLVDEEVMPLLSILNSKEGLVTTSSCSGRFQLISVPTAGDKLGSNIVGKWHRTVEVTELEEAIGSWNGEGELHLLVQPLLIHIRAKDIETGARLRVLAQQCGLKFSTIRSVKLDGDGNVQPWGVMVEVMGTERMEIPLDGIPKEALDSCLEPWVRRGNQLITRTKGHIDKMMMELNDQ